MAPPDKTVKRVRCNRLPRLDLAGMQCLSPFYQQIDLAADLIAPKIDGRFLAVANPGLRARPGKTIDFYAVSIIYLYMHSIKNL